LNTGSHICTPGGSLLPLSVCLYDCVFNEETFELCEERFLAQLQNLPLDHHSANTPRLPCPGFPSLSTSLFCFRFSLGICPPSLPSPSPQLGEERASLLWRFGIPSLICFICFIYTSRYHHPPLNLLGGFHLQNGDTPQDRGLVLSVRNFSTKHPNRSAVIILLPTERPQRFRQAPRANRPGWRPDHRCRPLVHQSLPRRFSFGVRRIAAARGEDPQGRPHNARERAAAQLPRRQPAGGPSPVL
jgi:hypothetical protein